jgi:magnesium transporter
MAFNMASNPKRPPPPSPQATSNKSGAQSHRSSRRPAASTNPSDDRGATVSETASQDTHQVATEQEGQAATNKPAKRKKNRNRRRHNRRQSFLAPEDSQLEAATAPAPDATTVSNLATDRPKPEAAEPFHKLGRALSSTSLESEALLDHRYV